MTGKDTEDEENHILASEKKTNQGEEMRAVLPDLSILYRVQRRRKMLRNVWWIFIVHNWQNH